MLPKEQDVFEASIRSFPLKRGEHSFKLTIQTGLVWQAFDCAMNCTFPRLIYDGGSVERLVPPNQMLVFAVRRHVQGLASIFLFRGFC